VDFAQVAITIPSTINIANLVGDNDNLLRAIEDRFDARITLRGDRIDISGDALEIQILTALFSDMIKTIEGGQDITLDSITQNIDLIRNGEFAPSILRADILLTYRGKAIRAKTAGQKRYVDAIRSNTVTFGIGPAGTGKTYLAMAMAVAALKRKEVGRVILTRPVVEAGESLGFLPGTLNEKIDPYIRPLYDALFDMTDMEKGNQLIAQGVIEIAPLAFMRGRTLNDSFIILDEAQNTTPDQMKMFLTRLGFGSKMVITGDVTQLDLPKRVSGLKSVRQILENEDDIAFIDLTGKDVVRHSLVQRIVAAYDAADARALARGER
jgi:phosphate starvation-inducible PhoH-like protein